MFAKIKQYSLRDEELKTFVQCFYDMTNRLVA